MKSRSQLGQDLLVLEFYNHTRNGYFLEVGAHNGVLFSNTYLLETEYGWTGICMEPTPHNFAKLVESRPGSYCSNKAAYHTSGLTVEFDVANNCDSVSGISANIDCHKVFVDYNKTTIRVETTTLSDLLRVQNAPSFIHYMSLDTEGSEYDILRGFPFDTHIVGLLHIEHNHVEPRRTLIRELLRSKGYVFTGANGVDDCYVHSSIVRQKRGAVLSSYGTLLQDVVMQLPLPSHKDPGSVVVPILAIKGCASVPESLETLARQTADSSRLHLYFVTSDHIHACEAFQKEHGSKYASIQICPVETSPQYFVHCAQRLESHLCPTQCRYLLEPGVFQMLLNSDIGILAPMLTSSSRYSNYHTHVSSSGYLVDNPQHNEILCRRVKGQLIVPVVNGIYFVPNRLLSELIYNDGTGREPYVIMSDALRQRGIPQLIDNREEYGTIV
jgi:FkbM family methyltransferase